MSRALPRALPQATRRYRQVRRLWHREGVRGLGVRARRAVVRSLERGDHVPEVLPADVLQADLAAPYQPPVPQLGDGQHMTVNWVMTPPGPGSGGHTTLFRLSRHLTARGHSCRIYLYDVYGSDAAYQRDVLRSAYPNFRGAVQDTIDGMDDAHAVSPRWQTAYPVFNARCSRQAVLSRPGPRAVVLSGEHRERARPNTRTNGIPRDHRRAVVGGKLADELRHGGRLVRLRLRHRSVRR